MDNIEDPIITRLSQYALDRARQATRCPDTQDELYQLGMIQIFHVWEHYPEKTDGERQIMARTAITNKIKDYFRHKGADNKANRNYAEIKYSDNGTMRTRSTVQSKGDGHMAVWLHLGRHHGQAHEAEFNSRLKQILDKLPPVLLQVYELRLAGKTAVEMMAVLGRSKRQIATYLHDLKEALRRGFSSSQEKYGEAPDTNPPKRPTSTSSGSKPFGGRAM